MHTADLLRLGRTYTTYLGLSMFYVGRRAANHGAFFSRLDDGADITFGRAARVAQWFSDRWPLDLPWPANIPRPDPAPDSEAVKELEAEIREARQNAVEMILEARDRADECVLRSDWEGVKRYKLKAIRAKRHAYDDIVRQFANGASASRPRKGSERERVLEVLEASGDERFAPPRPEAEASA